MKYFNIIRISIVAFAASAALSGCAAMGRAEVIDELAAQLEADAPAIPANYPIYSSAAVDCEGSDLVVAFKLLPEYGFANIDKQAVDNAKKAMAECLRKASASDDAVAQAVEAMKSADSSFVLKFIDASGESLIIKVPAKEITHNY